MSTEKEKVLLMSSLSPYSLFESICKAHKTVWMGIVNVNPASFSNGYEPLVSQSFQHALQLINQGAQILDIGAAPTNPKVHNSILDPNVEIDLLEPLLNRLHEYFNHQLNSKVLISLDTFSPIVAQYFAEKKMFHILNDIYAGRKYETVQLNHKIQTSLNTIDIAAKYELGYVLMHMIGQLDTLEITDKSNTTEEKQAEMLLFFEEKISLLKQKNVRYYVIDPGIGHGRFGKTTEDICKILSSCFIKKLEKFGIPILVGLSRKGFLQDLYPDLSTPLSRDHVSKEWERACIDYGVKIIRTHAL